MKAGILICLLTFLWQAAHSQNEKSGSLFYAGSRTKPDSNTVNGMLKQSRHYTLSHPDTALLLAQQALTLSRKLSYKKGEARSLNTMATAFLSVNNRPQALQSYLQAMKVYEYLGDEGGIAACEQNIGLSYIDQQEYQRALTYLYRSKRINEQRPDSSYLLSDLLYLGSCFEKMNQLDSAYAYATRAYNLAVQQQDNEKNGMTARVLGDVFAKRKQPEEAMYYYRVSLPYHKQASNTYGTINTMLGMAALFNQKGMRDSVLLYARVALETARAGGFPQLVLNASNFLANYFKHARMSDSAFVYQQLAMDIKDTLFSQEKVKSLQLLTLNEELRQQELAEQKLQEAKERTVNLQLLGIAFFIPLFFAVVLLLSRSKVSQKNIELLGTLSLLLLFEFIALFIHPHLERWTHHNPVLMLLILVGIGAVLVPLHHTLDKKVQALLLKRQLRSATAAKDGTVVKTDQLAKSGVSQKNT